MLKLVRKELGMKNHDLVQVQRGHDQVYCMLALYLCSARCKVRLIAIAIPLFVFACSQECLHALLVQ